jgi:hypothetical protein
VRPYSPDFNPIELWFAKLKGLLRTTRRRTVEEVWTTVGACLASFSAIECRNYFRQCGYAASTGRPAVSERGHLIQKSCSGSRQKIGVARRPATITPARAAWTFAGNIAASRTARPYAAAAATRGTSELIAPRNSHTPVAVTSRRGAGRLDGTIRIRPARVRGWKCAMAVKANSPARAKRSAPLDEFASCHEPASPIERAATQQVSMTINGAMHQRYTAETLGVLNELAAFDRERLSW